MSGHTTRDRCYEALANWHFREHHYPTGPSNRELFDRVAEVLKQERARLEKPDQRLPGPSEGLLIALANEIRGVGARSSQPIKAELLDRVLAALTPQQGKIVEYLWDRGTASYSTLETIPGAWRDVPSPEAVTAALKKIRGRLDENNLSVVSLTISDAKERVTLTRPAD